MDAISYAVSPARWVVCKVAGLVWRQAPFTRLSKLRLIDAPVPELPGPEWVRLRTRLGGVCGTDLALLTQRNHPRTILQAFSRFPAILGHENVAEIESLGAGVSGYSVGQRVCVESAVGCAGRGIAPPCSHCAAGRVSLCETPGDDRFPPRPLIGLNPRTGGTWAEYFVAHRSQLHAVPDAVPDEQAVLVDPIASAVHAVLRRPPAEGERVLVQGGGIVGLGVIAAIHALGCDSAVTIVVRHGFQADIARTLGATNVVRLARGVAMRERYDAIIRGTDAVCVDCDYGNHTVLGGYDLTYECTGSGLGLSDAIELTRSRGTVVVAGTTSIAITDTTGVWFNEITVVGANGRQIESVGGRSMHSYDVVFDWLASGRLDLSSLPVARYALADYRRAFRHLTTRQANPILKAAFDPGLKLL